MLKVRADDYVVPVWNDGTLLCKVLLRPIDAPFNIFGMPIFLGYYVTHNYARSSIEGGIWISPHSESDKPPVEIRK